MISLVRRWFGRAEVDRWKQIAWDDAQEITRLRELYENVVGNRERFGWTINHLLECEEALRTVEEENGRLRDAASDLLAFAQVVLDTPCPYDRDHDAFAAQQRRASELITAHGGLAGG